MLRTYPATASEYWEAATGGPARLQVLLQLQSADHADLLTQRLGGLSKTEVTLLDCEGSWLISLLLAADRQADQGLREIDALVDRFNRVHPGGGNAELLETRLVNVVPEEQPTGLFRLSERFQVAFGSDPPESQGGGNGGPIILEPGLAFGSGRHPSTRLAVAALEGWAAGQANLAGCRALDIGTGSGVLAIVCGRLGVGQVLAVDVCPQALTAAARNVRANSLSGRVEVCATPLAQISECFNLIVANLTPAVLAGLLDHIPQRLAASGTLITSGLMGRQAREFEEKLAGRGFAGAAVYREGVWRALRLRTAG